MLEFEQIVKTAYWIILGLLIVIIVGRYVYFNKTKSRRINIQKEQTVYSLFRYLTILSLPIFRYGLVSFVFVLQKGNMFAPNWMKNTLLVLLTILLITEIIYNIELFPKRINRISNILFLGLSGFVGIYLTNLYRSAQAHPPIEESIIIDLPFKGKWIATGAGASGLTNHHDRIASQKYAVDIAKLGNNNKLFTGNGVENEESHTYGAEVISPVAGRVVHLVDTLPDTPIKERDKLAGNHIVIQFQDTLYVALAHLQPKSIPFKVGDQVAVGDLVGNVGMSGNTDFCHLHVHIQDRPVYDIENGKAYPIRFREFKRKRFVFWSTVQNEYLLSNDMVEK